MNTHNLVDMRKRPPRNMDVIGNAMFGDHIPEIFREGKYYETGNIVYTYDTTTGDINVWECKKSGVYGRPAEPSWSNWSMDKIRTRLTNLEELIKNQNNVYATNSYDRSYLIHDVGVRDWEKRGSFLEVFNGRKYIPKKNYQIVDEEIIAANGDIILPKEADTTLYLSKSMNPVTNLIKRVEMYGTIGEDGRIEVPFPVDMSLIPSYIYDLYIDGVYISQNFITMENGENDWQRFITVAFDGEIADEYQGYIEDGTLETINPIDTITVDSECVFVFYLSISHDLTLVKNDFDKFIGDTRDSKWIDITDLDFREVYQEMNVYNNGIRMKENEYSISVNRVNVDAQEHRFLIGSFATASMKTFRITEDDVVPNVKEETVPIFEENTKLLPIPFLGYNDEEDHFLVFNDGGILLGNQKWFEDNGYVNVYDDDAGLTPNDMVEFRMISRDKNMEVRTYIITTTLDNQTTYVLPLKLKECYFHMLFTENGQYVSRTKYAISGNLLQIRKKYATMMAGERFELICFNYIGEFGFTSMKNYQSNWDPKYAEIIENTLPVENPELEPDDGDDRVEDENENESTDSGSSTPVIDYTPITNPDGTTLKFVPEVYVSWRDTNSNCYVENLNGSFDQYSNGIFVEEVAGDVVNRMITDGFLQKREGPGTRYIHIQDTATNTLESSITNSDVALVIGVDCDNQVICTTYNGDIVRFDRDGNEDTRYELKEVSTNAIDMLETDDFGSSYFHTYATLNLKKIDRKGNVCWEFDGDHQTHEQPVSHIRSIKYIDGYLYVEYSPYSQVEYTMARIDAESGVFHPISIIVPTEDNIDAYKYCAKISPINDNHIYIGSNGHVVYEFESNGLFVKKYTDLVEDFNGGNVIDVYADAEGNVYAISENQMDYSCQLIKYNSEGDLVYTKQYFGNIQMTFDIDGYIYLFDAAALKFSKLDKENGDEIWEYVFKDGISELNSFFVDPVDYHVYAYYVNSNRPDHNYWYLELEQVGLPFPKYRHELVFNCDENVTTTDLLGTTLREINLVSSPTNRLYIGTMDGSIYTYTQAMREMSKKRTVKLWVEENPDIPVYIIPDGEYNFYVVKNNIIEKWNRYERLKWRYDGIGIVTEVTRTIVLNPVSKELVFIYGDTDGRLSLGKLSPDGEFEQLNVTLPNGVRIEDGNCSISCNERGDYFIGYTGKTIYRYSENFNLLSRYGMDTDALLDGPAGNIVQDSAGYVYIAVKGTKDDTKYDKLIKYNPVGTVVWEHNFMNECSFGQLFIDKDDNVYVCDEREIRKLDGYGNYVWRFKFRTELGKYGEPEFLVMDEFYRLFFMDSEYNLHRIDQYDLTLDPIPDEEPEPPEPEDIIPEEPDDEKNYIKVQRSFGIPFEFDRANSAMLIFTNTGAYVGKRFYDIYENRIVLKGTPIYENGWLDIVLVENVKESIIL